MPKNDLQHTFIPLLFLVQRSDLRTMCNGFIFSVDLYSFVSLCRLVRFVCLSLESPPVGLSLLCTTRQEHE